MPQNNIKIYPGTGDKTPTEAAALLREAFVTAYGSSSVVDTDTGTVWVDAGKSLGIRIDIDSAGRVRCEAVNRNGGVVDIQVLSSGSADYVMVYNKEPTSGVFAFHIGPANANAYLDTVICKDSNGEAFILHVNNSSSSVFLSGEVTLNVNLSPVCNDINAASIAMVPLPSFVRPMRLQNLYHVFSTPNISWGYDSTIYCDGDLYKVCSATSSGAAVAFKI